MRRMRGDGGAVAVLVALLMVVLVGMAAFVIDTGALYQERRELQNGADAGALAIAEDCASGALECVLSVATGTANSYADRNADDLAADASIVRLEGGMASGLVEVRTTTVEAATGADSVAFRFAQVLGFSGETVSANATAQWGAVGGAASLPLTIGSCEFAQATLDGTVYAEEPFTDDTLRVINFHDPKDAESTCPADGEAGANEPGGFGWLDGEGCSTETDADGWAGGGTGSSELQDGCKELLASLLGTTVLIPVFDQTNGLNGSNTKYHIAGYAGFHLTGYKFPGATSTPPPGCAPSVDCIAGHFTTFITDATEIGGPYMGASAIRLIG